MINEPIPRGERTQSEILQAAWMLFIQKGYHGTSMRQIADASNLAVGSIYNHYKSKEDIFMAVLLRYHPIYEILPAIQNAKGNTVEDFVRDSAILLIQRLGKRKDFLNLMFIELVEFKAVHIPVLIEKMLPNTLEFAQRFLENKDELRPIPLPILVRAFLGLFFSYFITDFILGDVDFPGMRENALEHFVDIFLHGILTENEAAL